MAGRTIAVGDVHGCSAALAAVLEAVRPGPDDTVVTLGDYINRGPDSPGVLDLLVGLTARCRLVPLLGNHEEVLLAALRASVTLGSLAAAEEALPPAHLDFLRGCRRYHETQTHLFCHAGYDAGLPMDRQPTSVLLFRFVDPSTARPHRSGKVAVVGHTEQASGEVLDLGFLLCIDTACHAGGWLTALDIGSGRVWQADKGGRLRG